MKGPTEYEQMMKTKKRKYGAKSGTKFLYFMIAFIIIVLTLAYTSIVVVDYEEMAIATHRNSGIAEECLSPGVTVKPFVKVTHKLEYMSYTVIPHGKLGVVTNKATNLQNKILHPGHYKINLDKYEVQLKDQDPDFEYNFDENGELIYGISRNK